MSAATFADASVITPIATVVAAVIVVYGGLLHQRYIASSNRIRDRYKELRGAYVTFAANAQNYASVCKSVFALSGKRHEIAAAIVNPSIRPVRASGTMLRDEAENVRTAALEDMKGSSALEQLLNEQLSSAATALHHSYLTVVMLDSSATRRRDLMKWHGVVQGVKKDYDEAAAKKLSVCSAAQQAFDGLEEWIAQIGADVFAEESRQLNIDQLDS